MTKPYVCGVCGKLATSLTDQKIGKAVPEFAASRDLEPGVYAGWSDHPGRGNEVSLYVVTEEKTIIHFTGWFDHAVSHFVKLDCNLAALDKDNVLVPRMLDEGLVEAAREAVWTELYTLEIEELVEKAWNAILNKLEDRRK